MDNFLKWLVAILSIIAIITVRSFKTLFKSCWLLDNCPNLLRLLVHEGPSTTGTRSSQVERQRKPALPKGKLNYSKTILFCIFRATTSTHLYHTSHRSAKVVHLRSDPKNPIHIRPTLQSKRQTQKSGRDDQVRPFIRKKTEAFWDWIPVYKALFAPVLISSLFKRVGFLLW